MGIEQTIYRAKLYNSEHYVQGIYLISRNTTCSTVVPTVAGRCKATSHKNKGRNNIQSSVYLK